MQRGGEGGRPRQPRALLRCGCPAAACMRHAGLHAARRPAWLLDLSVVPCSVAGAFSCRCSRRRAPLGSVHSPLWLCSLIGNPTSLNACRRLRHHCGTQPRRRHHPHQAAKRLQEGAVVRDVAYVGPRCYEAQPSCCCEACLPSGVGHCGAGQRQLGVGSAARQQLGTQAQQAGIARSGGSGQHNMAQPTASIKNRHTIGAIVCSMAVVLTLRIALAGPRLNNPPPRVSAAPAGDQQRVPRHRGPGVWRRPHGEAHAQGGPQLPQVPCEAQQLA